MGCLAGSANQQRQMKCHAKKNLILSFIPLSLVVQCPEEVDQQRRRRYPCVGDGERAVDGVGRVAGGGGQVVVDLGRAVVG